MGGLGKKKPKAQPPVMSPDLATIGRAQDRRRARASNQTIMGTLGG